MALNSLVKDKGVFILHPLQHFPRTDRGWSGGAMVLGKLPVPGRPTYLE